MFGIDLVFGIEKKCKNKTPKHLDLIVVLVTYLNPTFGDNFLFFGFFLLCHQIENFVTDSRNSIEGSAQFSYHGGKTVPEKVLT